MGRFRSDTSYEGSGTWMQLSQSQAYRVWSGYAFEGICMKHIPQIKHALGIGAVYTTTYSFLKKVSEDQKGLQVDMVMERADRVIHLFEIKFYNTEFVLTKDYAERLRERLHLFRQLLKSRKQVVLTMINTFGLKVNNHSIGLVEQSLTLDDLFW